MQQQGEQHVRCGLDWSSPHTAPVTARSGSGSTNPTWMRVDDEASNWPQAGIDGSQARHRHLRPGARDPVLPPARRRTRVFRRLGRPSPAGWWSRASSGLVQPLIRRVYDATCGPWCGCRADVGCVVRARQADTGQSRPVVGPSFAGSGVSCTVRVVPLVSTKLTGTGSPAVCQSAT